LLVGGLGGCGDSAEVAVFEAVAVSLHGDDLGVVDEVVDHGGDDDVVAEGFAPAAERLVAGDDQAGSFVAGGDQLEEEVGCFGFEGMCWVGGGRRGPFRVSVFPSPPAEPDVPVGRASDSPRDPMSQARYSLTWPTKAVSSWLVRRKRAPFGSTSSTLKLFGSQSFVSLAKLSLRVEKRSLIA
jgi:hypothetical protein